MAYCSDGLVGYDTTFTRWGSRVRLPLGARLFPFPSKHILIELRMFSIKVRKKYTITNNLILNLY